MPTLRWRVRVDSNSRPSTCCWGGVSEAFDVTKEDPRIIARYDTGHIRFSRQTAASANYIANSQTDCAGQTDAAGPSPGRVGLPLCDRYQQQLGLARS